MTANNEVCIFAFFRIHVECEHGLDYSWCLAHFVLALFVVLVFLRLFGLDYLDRTGAEALDVEEALEELESEELKPMKKNRFHQP